MVLASVGLFSVLFALIEGERFGWGRVWGVLTIPVLALIGVVFTARYARPTVG